MNYIDIVIVVPLLYFFIKGFSNGLIKEVTDLFGLITGVYIAVNFSYYLHPNISNLFQGNLDLVPIISFTVLFFVTLLMIRLLGYMLETITKALALGFISKLLGAVFGMTKVLVFFSFMLFFLTEYKLITINDEEDSVLIPPIKQMTQKIIPHVNQHKEKLLEKVEQQTIRAKKHIEENTNSEEQ